MPSSIRVVTGTAASVQGGRSASRRRTTGWRRMSSTFRYVPTHAGGGSGAVMTVGDVESVNLGVEEGSYAVCRIPVVNHPENVTETILVNEVILRLSGNGICNDGLQFGVVLIGEEHRFYVGILYSDVNHPVVFLVFAGKFVFLDLPGHVIVRIGAQHKAVLGALPHSLGIDVIAGLVVLDKPAPVLPLLEIPYRPVIHPLVVVFQDRFEIYFRFGDMQQGFLSGHFFCLCGIQYVIGRRSHLGNNVFRRPYRRKRPYSYHNAV